MRIIVAIVFFILGTLLSGLICHGLWLVYLQFSGTGNEPVVGFGIPTEVIVYLISLFLVSIGGGILALLIFLRKSKVKNR